MKSLFCKSYASALSVIAMLAFSASSIALEQKAVAGMASEGELSCSVCHGSNWQGNVLLGSPNLQILPASYIKAQLKSYQLGWRQRAQAPDISDDMAVVARTLSNAQIEQALRVKKTLKPVLNSASTTGFAANNLALGRASYTACEACHGRDALGLEAVGAPPLAGQQTEYLKAQLYSFGEGRRGKHKDDRLGQQMASALPWPMSTEVMDALLAYISTL